MLADSGIESGGPGKLYDPYFGYKGVGSTMVYFPKRLSTLKSGRAFFTKGTYNVTFATPFVTPDTYMVIPYGSTGAAAFSPIITDVSHLNYFTMKVPVEGYVSWVAYVISNE
jgi:hypothetical protein